MAEQPQPTQQQMRYTGEGAKDLAAAIGIVVFAIAGFVFINPENARVYPGDGGITWQTMPLAYAFLLLLLGIIYAFQSFAKMRRESAAPAPEELTLEDRVKRRTVLIRRVASIGLLLVFVSLLKVLGLAVLAPVFLFLLFRLYQRGSWQGDIVISLIGGACLWALFVPILHLNLRGGDLDPVTPFLMNVFKAVGF